MTSMQIVNIFHLSLGGTVLAGKLPEEIRLGCHQKYTANLIIDGSIYQQNIHITGEMIGGKHPDGYRAIATMEVLNLDSDFIKSHDCQLLLFEDNTPNL